MKIYFSIDEIKSVSNSIVTIGTFDGVHLGHQQILNKLKTISDECNGETVLITFFPHPRTIISPESNILQICTLDEKISLLKGKIDHLVVIPFNRDFSNLSSEEFIKTILLDKLNIKKLVIGYDHHFGKDREGNFEILSKFAKLHNFDIERLSATDFNKSIISSTSIRNALNKGDIKLANNLLGYNFCVSGKVIKGNQIGRTIGFPTANIFIEESYKILPLDGSYAVLCYIENNIYKGMLYIGNRPTINGMTHNVEVNIFNFNSEIYNNNIKVEFIDFIRNDIKFKSLDELKNQLFLDKQKAIKILEQ